MQEEEFLQEHLQRIAHLSMQDRVEEYNARYPQRPITLRYLRYQYKLRGIRKKAVKTNYNKSLKDRNPDL